MTVSNGTPGKPPAGPPPNGQTSAGGNGQHGKDRDEELATARTAGGQAGAAGTARPVTAAPTRTPVPGSPGVRPPTSAPSANPVPPRTAGPTGQAARPAPNNPFAPRPTAGPPPNAAPRPTAGPPPSAAPTGQPAPDTSAKKPDGAVPFWDSPQAAQPRQSLRERLGLGRKKTADEEPSGRPAVAPTAPAPTSPPPSATAGPAGAAAAGGLRPRRPRGRRCRRLRRSPTIRNLASTPDARRPSRPGLSRWSSPAPPRQRPEPLQSRPSRVRRRRPSRERRAAPVLVHWVLLGRPRLLLRRPQPHCRPRPRGRRLRVAHRLARRRGKRPPGRPTAARPAVL